MHRAGIKIALILVAGAIMAQVIQLPEPPGAEMSVHEAIAQRRSRRGYAEGGMTLEQISEVLWSAAGITADGRFRAAPSAGATYPMDTYLVAGNVTGLEKGIYRYIEQEHALELVKPGDYINALADAALGQSSLRNASAVVGLFAIYERTAKRYGERAERYVHMEAGHIGQNIHLVAEALNLSTVMIGAFKDDEVAELFGVEGAPVYFMPLGPR